MVDLLAILIFATVAVNFTLVGSIKNLNSEISEKSIALEKAQGDIRSDFLQVRLYANFSYYKIDTEDGYDTILMRSICVFKPRTIVLPHSPMSLPTQEILFSLISLLFSKLQKLEKPTTFF